MKVEVKKVDTLTRELKFEIPKERVSKTLESIYQEIGKVAKVKGFRQGKVPRNILVSTHGKIAQEEMVKKIIPEAYHEGIGKENLDPIDLPEIGDVNVKDGVLTFTATLDIRPEIIVKNYKGLKVQRKSAVVTEEEINKTLEVFKKGQDKDKEVVLDDAFARGLGFPTFAEFRQALERQLQMDKDRQNRADVEHQIIDALLKETKFVVPQSMVKKQMEYRLYEAQRHYKSHNMPDAEIQKKLQELQDGQLKEAVERDVRVYLVFQQIAKAENITVNQGESIMPKVMEFLLKEASWQEGK